MAFLIVLATVPGCASFYPNPSNDEIARADYGEAPDLEVVKPKITESIERRLRDPDSVKYRWENSQPHTAWFRPHLAGPDKYIRFAWRVAVLVNSKNGFGGYTGFEIWECYFRGNSLVGWSVPVWGRNLRVVRHDYYEVTGAFPSQ